MSTLPTLCITGKLERVTYVGEGPLLSVPNLSLFFSCAFYHASFAQVNGYLLKAMFLVGTIFAYHVRESKT